MVARKLWLEAFSLIFAVRLSRFLGDHPEVAAPSAEASKHMELFHVGGCE